MIRAVAVSLAFLLLSAPALADDVERVMLQYFDAMEYEDYDAAARLFDAADMKAFRASFDFMKDLEPQQQQAVWEQMIGPWATQESVEKMSDEEFFASVYGFAMGQAMAQSGMSFPQSEYIGHVPEGNLAHAVTRSTIAMGDREFSDTSVTTLKKTDSGWKMQLSGDIERLALQIKAAFGQ